MKLVVINAKDFLVDNLPFPIEVEVKENADGMIGANIRSRNKFYSSKNKDDSYIHFCVIAVDENKNKIIGYFYFFYDLSINHCELFSAFVGCEYRRQGVAMILSEKAINVAKEAGCSHFIIRFSEPTQERHGLFEYYQRYAKAESHLAFEIYYDAQLYEYP